jgi:cysteine synthase
LDADSTWQEVRFVPIESRGAHAASDPRNLFRVHWHNAADRRGFAAVPDHLVLPRELTGVEAPIVVALADRFPMIASHKVLAAYACLAPRLVTGQFDPTLAARRCGPRPATTAAAAWRSAGSWAAAAWPSCPEGMSAERFDWLEAWVADPSDIIRTPGTESNVKEIYDKCASSTASRTR